MTNEEIINNQNRINWEIDIIENADYLIINSKDYGSVIFIAELSPYEEMKEIALKFKRNEFNHLSD